MILRRQKHATVQRHGRGYRVFAVPERHPFAVRFHLDYSQVLHRMPEAALLVRAHLDRFRRGVDGQPQRAERVVGAVHAKYYWAK